MGAFDWAEFGDIGYMEDFPVTGTTPPVDIDTYVAAHWDEPGVELMPGPTFNHVTPVPVPPVVQPVPVPYTPEPRPVKYDPLLAQQQAQAQGFNGIDEAGAELGGGGVATPVAFPIAGALVARFVSLGALKTLLRTWGPKMLKLLIGAAAFKELMDLIGLGAPDATLIKITPGQKKRRRYSIGSNPRVGTLQKVSRHCQRLLKRHEKVIREFLPKRQGLPARALARTYLSTAERAALKA